jgi:hypothetical protein
MGLVLLLVVWMEGQEPRFAEAVRRVKCIRNGTGEPRGTDNPHFSFLSGFRSQ